MSASTEKLKFHWFAERFPTMDDEGIANLAKDIQAQGQQFPIILDQDGLGIDGRNRAIACALVGVEPLTQWRHFKGDAEVIRFIWSANSERRHLTSSQKAVLSLEMLPALEEEARERKRQHGGTAPGRSKDHSVNSLTECSDADNEGKAAQAAAAITGTNRQYISDAKRLQTEAPELLERVRVGELSIPAAVRESRPHVANNSGNNEWYTPSLFIECARACMGSIDTDPASSEVANQTVKANVFYTEQEDGLRHRWAGNVWMNPPYASPLIGQFADAITTKYIAGEIAQACILVNNATETAWFQTMLRSSSGVCFVKSRIKFLDPSGAPSGAPLQGQCVLYMGPNVQSFAEEFGDIGEVWGPYVG